MLRYLSVLAYATLLACATTQPDAPVHNPQSVKVFNATVAQRDAQLTRWKQASSEDRQYCEMRVGECEVTVADQRHDLISEHAVPHCRAKANSTQEALCIIDELVKQENADPATKYVKADVWCLSRLNNCVAQHQQELADKERTDRIAHRRRVIETSPQGVAWHARVAAASEKIKYIRATLPPDADSECQKKAGDDADCDTSIDALDTQFQSELSKSEAEYNGKKAQKLYEELTKKEASCYEPELRCLSKAVAKYGETNESRRWLQQNFDLLDKRQRLIEKAGDHAAAPCIESAVASHQADIVQSYKAYVREPVLFFRTQLHRSFVALHKSEIDCLGGVGDDSPTSG